MSTAALVSPPRLRIASLDDHEQIVRLESAHEMEVMSRDHWSDLWLNNPLWPRLGKNWPIGWVLEDAAGQIVGSLGNIPSLYRFQDRELICANGRSWVVAPEYRSFSLSLMAEYFDQPAVDLYVNTTVGPVAEPMIETLSERIPLGDYQTSAYWAPGYYGIAKRAWQKMNVPLAGWLAYPTAAALRLKDALFLKSFPPAPASIVVERIDRFDDRFDAFWEELVRQNRDNLLGVRDARTLTWHYATPLRNGHLWVFTASRQGRLCAYCTIKQQDRSGPLRRMRLVEYQTIEPHEDLLSGLLHQALRCCAAEGIEVLEQLGCNLPKMQVIDRLAPYRRKQPSWSYYYLAPDPALARELARPEAWDPSMYDGDASFD